MILAIVNENSSTEKRVSLIPKDIELLIKKGFEVLVEKDAGQGSYISDEEYKKSGAKIIDSKKELFGKSDIILKVGKIQNDEIEYISAGKIVICCPDSSFEKEMVQKCKEKKALLFAMDQIPRTTKAQSMDVLSAGASIAGYKAVIKAADVLSQYFPMMMTAAGTILPTKVFILGVGVAGLQAIATAKRLGAKVSAYDIRPVVKEQVESLGAKFIEFEMKNENAEEKTGYAKEQTKEDKENQQKQMAKIITESDVVITTAMIPGRKSPILITDEMVSNMKVGSVIVDIATAKGGNVEGSREGEIIEKYGVNIIGFSDYPSQLSMSASKMYSKNITNFILEFLKEGEFVMNKEDEIISNIIIC